MCCVVRHDMTETETHCLLFIISLTVIILIQREEKREFSVVWIRKKEKREWILGVNRNRDGEEGASERSVGVGIEGEVEGIGEGYRRLRRLHGGSRGRSHRHPFGSQTFKVSKLFGRLSPSSRISMPHFNPIDDRSRYLIHGPG